MKGSFFNRCSYTTLSCFINDVVQRDSALDSTRWHCGLWASRWLVQAMWWSLTASTLPF